MNLSEQFKAGENLAHNVLTNHWADEFDNAVIELPVDSTVVAKHVGLKVETAFFIDKTITVLTKSQNDRAKITLSQHLKRGTEMRFMVAFELGRALENPHLPTFGHVDSIDLLDWSEYNQFAYGFAMGLLMPASAVRQEFSTGKSIRKIARTFGVTSHMVFQRLATLGFAELV